MRARAIAATMLLVASMVFSAAESAVAATSVPDTVRIGIYYGSKAVSGLSVTAAAGFEIGRDEEGFQTLADVPIGETRNIRKDGWFVRQSSGSMTEYASAEAIPSGSTAIGPYHVRIGGDRKDYAAAKAAAEAAAKAGVTAYPAYDGAWQLWSGFLTTPTAAQSAMKTLADSLSDQTLEVIAADSDNIVVYDASFNVSFVYGGEDGALQMEPKPGASADLLSVNGKRFRGLVEVRRMTGSDMTVVNEINLEQYLYGVVPSEIQASGPYEAVKAQAVAARTYAACNVNRYAKWGFDMTDTIDSQVYGGYDAEQPASNKAVNETAGKVAWYDGEIAQLFYFSSSGGATEDNVNVWGTDVPYLRSVKDPYESGDSYNYYWQKSMTAADVDAALASSGVDIGDVLTVTAMAYSDAGRVTKLKITGTSGSIVYHNEDCRIIFSLPSQMYQIGGSTAVSALGADGAIVDLPLDSLSVVTADGTEDLDASDGTLSILGSDNARAIAGTSSDLFVFSGKGWGHGIGMSQEGAKGYALQGYDYEQILEHYFTGINIG